jgi:hypothetical protein
MTNKLFNPDEVRLFMAVGGSGFETSKPLSRMDTLNRKSFWPARVMDDFSLFWQTPWR